VIVRNELPSDEILHHKLWIGNLDKRLTEYHLMQICKPYGSVKHLVYLFHTQGAQTGQPKGYCFVEYSSRQEADNARRSLNGKIALGRQLKVNWAQPASAVSSDEQHIKTKLWCVLY
jgi:RNA recognition motif-containing protein